MNDEDDKAWFQRNLSKSVSDYAELYPSLTRRLEEIDASDDPYIRQFVDDLIAATGQQKQARSNWFADRYGLSAREARVAMHLAGGGSVADYARRYGLSEQTVRSQLKSVFAKTGVNRQSALAGLMLTSEFPKAPGSS